jgi:GTPase SAR1 family protein
MPGKDLVLYGPRQVGKTTLANDLLATLSIRSRFINTLELIYREPLSTQNRLMRIVVIDALICKSAFQLQICTGFITSRVDIADSLEFIPRK